MAYPDLRERLAAICSDPELSDADKISALRQMEADARAKQRATNESMPSPRPEDGEELKVIENALLSMGVETTDPGAATL
jgi:hypothetical protein